MIVLYRPSEDELEFRASLLADAQTMSYNRAWGGAVGFPRERRKAWYDRWLVHHEGRRFYRYLRESETGRFVGETAYHFDDAQGRWMADVIVAARERGRGFGREGLTQLCEAARLHGIGELWDELAPDNPADTLLRGIGFTEEGCGAQGVLYRKDLRTVLNRILVVGCPGAGKSTFARALRDADKNGLPLHYLDMLFHRPDRTTAPRGEFDADLAQIMTQPRWIIDGNYQRTLPQRFAACDTAYVFDLPVDVCLEGARSRIGRAREDMPWIEERFDPEFRQYILDFPRDQRPAIEHLAAQYGGEKRIVTFKTRSEAKSYLQGLRQTDGTRTEEEAKK